MGLKFTVEKEMSYTTHRILNITQSLIYLGHDLDAWSTHGTLCVKTFPQGAPQAKTESDCCSKKDTQIKMRGKYFVPTFYHSKENIS
jgi:hypothetical protein